MANAKKRVLAVDDDASVCEFYEHALRLGGYDVECAPSAAKARDVLAKRRPDLILMDIMMPDQDGISFTRELRADPKTSDIPIIVISGLADAGTLNDALLFGA
jgi:CheY-like chemotaxis protein